MSRLVKDYVQIKDCADLDALIDQLVAVRDSLPQDAQAEVKLRGDEVFGRHLAISFYRPQTTEEAEVDARYAEAYRQSRERELSRLQQELDAEDRAARRLRMVA
jgi:hypothetical protein